MGILDKVKETIMGKKEEPKEVKEGEALNVTEKTKEAPKKETPKEPTRMPETKEAMEADKKKSPLVEALKTIEDPELGIDIWTLGLIYNIDIKEKEADIRMTFTSIMCPVGPMIVKNVKDKLEALDSIEKTNIEVVFSPPWEPTEELREMLGV
jgi:metal-sulfur cluster biosynthetic enzyme